MTFCGNVHVMLIIAAQLLFKVSMELTTSLLNKKRYLQLLRHYQLVSKLKYSQGMSYGKDFIMMIIIIIMLLLLVIIIFTGPSCTIYVSIDLLKEEDSIKLLFDFLKPNKNYLGVGLL